MPVGRATMEDRAPAAGRSQALRQALLIPVLASLAGASLRAQEIRIRVLDAHNGKPVTRECTSISFGTWHGADIWAATNRDGVAVLHLANHVLGAETGCNGWRREAPFPPSASTIAIQSDYHVDCQEHGRAPLEPGKAVPLEELWPAYSITRILDSGITASNTCGKFRTGAKPGELVTFVRSAGLLEKLRE